MKVMLVKGGPSLEYEVSLRSAETIGKTLLALGHEVEEVLIPQSGSLPKEIFSTECDIAWPVMHGHLGEDGLIQGLFECLSLPYVSEDVATSAIGMDKSLQTALFRDAGIGTVPTLAIRKGEAIPTLPFEAERFMVKMNSGGSSIGVYPADRASLEERVKRVHEMDEIALIQPLVCPLRELETLVVRDNRTGSTKVLGPIEVKATRPYHLYENKYSSAVSCVFPSDDELSPALRKEIVESAARAFDAVHGSIYMRIDFFLSGEELMINEINTIPGSTETSHIIHLAKEIGGMESLVSLLLDSAMVRYERRKALGRCNA